MIDLCITTHQNIQTLTIPDKQKLYHNSNCSQKPVCCYKNKAVSITLSKDTIIFEVKFNIRISGINEKNQSVVKMLKNNFETILKLEPMV